MKINQLSRIRRNKKKTIIKKEEKKSPQIKGITIKIYTMTPKKPNSALRKVAKVKINKFIKINNKKKNILLAYIPGEKHSLSIHNLVLLIPGKTKDLPGIKYKIIRGNLDCKPPIRNTRRSLYGVPKIKK